MCSLIVLFLSVHCATMTPVRAFLVVNPVAGSRFRRMAVEKAISYLLAQDLPLDLERTTAAGQATQLARRAALEGYDVVIACGGDGTVSEVANGLAGTGVPMGVLPAGTVNIWATEAGIPLEPRAAAQVVLRGSARSVDLGIAGSRHFLLMAGLGLDGAVARNLSLPMKRSLGKAAYVLAGMWTAAGFTGSQAQIVVDGQRLERNVVWMVIGNTRLYGGMVTVTPDAKIDDGLLDLCIFSGRGFFSSSSGLAALMCSRHLSLKSVEYRRCHEVSVEGLKPLPIQADGDYIGATPQTFRIAPQALQVLLPLGARTSLFSRSDRKWITSN